jgi:hypothetical protein
MLCLAQTSVDPIQMVSQSLFALMPWLIVLGVLSFLGAFFKRRFLPKIKGVLGEWAVNRALLKKLSAEDYRVLHDLLLPDGKGGQTQIDHVVVSAFGIFVIETKNWDCWIFGDERGAYWTLSYRGRRKNKTLNPLLQNEGHVKAVCEVLGVKRGHCHNLVFINPVSKLKTGPIPGVFQHGMLDHIRSFRERVFNPEWVPAAVKQLMVASQSGDKQAVAAHLAQVKSKSARQYA